MNLLREIVIGIILESTDSETKLLENKDVKLKFLSQLKLDLQRAVESASELYGVVGLGLSDSRDRKSSMLIVESVHDQIKNLISEVDKIK